MHPYQGDFYKSLISTYVGNLNIFFKSDEINTDFLFLSILLGASGLIMLDNYFPHTGNLLLCLEVNNIKTEPKLHLWME